MMYIKRIVRRFIFGSLPPNADGWYVWRLNKDWPKHCWQCVEVANGVMVDIVPGNNEGMWIIEECKPYGQFRGPILAR